MDDDLEARLQSHSQAFEGLLSLIPAKEYYAKDNSDQWQAKKQTKEQKRLARKAKLDPANQKTAKDVMDENERKRKRELGQDDESEAEDESSLGQHGSVAGKPNGLTTAKRQKVEANSKTDDEKRQLKADKRRQKREKKQEKVDKKRAKTEAKKTAREDEDLKEALSERRSDDAHNEDDDEEADRVLDFPNMDEQVDIEGFADNGKPSITSDQSSTPASNLDSPTFDLPSGRQSASSSSTSSILPSKQPESTKTAAQPAPVSSIAATTTKLSQEALQARLKARIEHLRAARKADGPDNSGPRSRQDLLDARRKKSDARKQHKKELRAKAKQEEERLLNERLRGSGSPLTNPDLFSPMLSPALSKATSDNFSFGRVAFGDGVQANASLEGLIDTERSNKRPKDVRHALDAAERKAARLAGLDADKRGEIESKDAWLNAKKRAHGERVRDDASLLKKTLKRREGAKLKSGREWNERTEGVKKTIEARQKKREENLKARRDGKGKGGKKSGGGAGAGAAAKKRAAGNKKKKGRPGFEGR